MRKSKQTRTHKGDKRSPHREDVNRVVTEQELVVPDLQRIKNTTVPHKGSRQPYGVRDGK